MKSFIKLISFIGLCSIPQLTFSAPITDTYATGDTLTASTLNNIKSAVNDNDSRINNITSTAAIATGGEILETGGYRIHIFKSSSVFTVHTAVDVDVLVVAGGGAGGKNHTTNANGGGGGGGVIYQTVLSLSPGENTVTVGAGGGGDNLYNGAVGHVGRNGENSVFGTLVAFGGGGGGSSNGGPGQDGGSGGGGAYYQPASGVALQTGTGGHGNAGGLGNQAWTGGGGGGAGSAGIDGNVCGNCAPSGDGGAGFGSDITGTMRYYGGGGGGGANTSERAGDGMDGGGRGFGTTSHYTHYEYFREINATTRGSGTPDAVPNTGGGGGGASYWGFNVNWFGGSGAGGSGIVIVRYLL